MSWQEFVGHQPLIEMFRRAWERGRTGHAFLLLGPAGIGKRTFARNITQTLFCERRGPGEFDACGLCSACKQVAASTHPDLIEIGCPPGKRELPIALIAGDKERRGKEGLCHDLSLRPMSAASRIAIIDDAETMNEESANSLLKTLEEPPPGAILFLLAPDLTQILPTIRSRCQVIRFTPLTPEELTTLILRQGLVSQPAEAAELAAVAEGSLETAAQLLDAGLLRIKTGIEKQLATRPLNGLAVAKALEALFDELGGDTSRQREYLAWSIHFTVAALRAALRQPQSAEVQEQLGLMLDRCFEAEQHFEQSMPVPLCLEALWSDLSSLTRTPTAI